MLSAHELETLDEAGWLRVERALSPADVAATVYQALDIDPQTTIPGPEGQPVALVEGVPLQELVG